MMSPQLTGIYNAEFTARFFERVPGLELVADGTLDVTRMVMRLEVGLGLMIVGYVGGLWAIGWARGRDALASVGSARGGGAGARVGSVVVGCAVVFRLTL